MKFSENVDNGTTDDLIFVVIQVTVRVGKNDLNPNPLKFFKFKSNPFFFKRI